MEEQSNRKSHREREMQRCQRLDDETGRMERGTNLTDSIRNFFAKVYG